MQEQSSYLGSQTTLETSMPFKLLTRFESLTTIQVTIFDKHSATKGGFKMGKNSLALEKKSKWHHSFIADDDGNQALARSDFV